MKLFKKTNLFYSVLLAAGVFLTACSFSSGGGTTTPSSKTDNGLTHEEGGAINHNDGNAIAYFLCEDLCNSQDETVKLVFYPDGKFAIRATILSTGITTKTANDDHYCELYGVRYDKYRGTYTGDPTKDGALTVNFTEKSSISIGPDDENITSMEELYSQEWHQRIKYEPYTNTTADIKVTIKDDVATFSNGPYGSSYSKYEFVKTDKNDLGPYRYDGISRRQNDNRRKEWTIPEGYTSVADSAFCRSRWSSNESDYYQYLKKVKLPSTIKKIGNSAFYNCTGLEEINIPEGCTEIGSSAFYNCYSLKTITLPKSLKKFDSGAFGKASNRTNDKGEQEEIPSNLVVTFADGITTIPEGCFRGNSRNSLIKSIVLPSSVKIIENNAFYDMELKEPIVISEGIEEIGDYAFENSISSDYGIIDEFVLPSTLKKIGKEAFNGWKIKKLVISGDIEEYGEKAFQNIEELVLPKGLKKIPANAFKDWKIKKVVIPEGVEEIGENAFYKSNSYSYYDSDSDSNYTLSELILPKTLKKICDGAFYGNKLTSLVLPEGIEEIGKEAFYHDSSSSDEKLTELILPKSLKKIGEHAFYENKILKFDIPEGVEEIESRAFYSYSYNSDDKIELSLPTTLKKLASDAFYNGYVKTINSNSTLYDLNNLIGNLTFRPDVKIYCGEEDVTAFFRKLANSSISSYMWVNENDTIKLILKYNKTYILTSGTKAESGVWYTEGDDYYKGVINLCPKDGVSRTYDYKYDSDEKTLDIANLATLTKVSSFSVIEKKETTNEKWCENAMQENGKYIYYQYYLNKAQYSYLDYVDTTVYYNYYDEDNNSLYENRYYKSCKDEIESQLNNDRYSYTSKYDSDTNSFFYLYSNPQPEDSE